MVEHAFRVAGEASLGGLGRCIVAAVVVVQQKPPAVGGSLMVLHALQVAGEVS